MRIVGAGVAGAAGDESTPGGYRAEVSVGCMAADV